MRTFPGCRDARAEHKHGRCIPRWCRSIALSRNEVSNFSCLRPQAPSRSNVMKRGSYIYPSVPSRSRSMAVVSDVLKPTAFYFIIICLVGKPHFKIPLKLRELGYEAAAVPGCGRGCRKSMQLQPARYPSFAGRLMPAPAWSCRLSWLTGIVCLEQKLIIPAMSIMTVDAACLLVLVDFTLHDIFTGMTEKAELLCIGQQKCPVGGPVRIMTNSAAARRKRSMQFVYIRRQGMAVEAKFFLRHYQAVRTCFMASGAQFRGVGPVLIKTFFCFRFLFSCLSS